MGTWRITIEGTGAHHNGLERDADAIARKTVEELKQSQVEISKAEFTLRGSKFADDGVTIVPNETSESLI